MCILYAKKKKKNKHVIMNEYNPLVYVMINRISRFQTLIGNCNSYFIKLKFN